MPENPPKRSILSAKKKIKNNYGMYSGIINDEGKPVDNPTEEQTVKTMVKYMQKNSPESNVYHPKFMHHSTIFDKKTPQNNA